MNKLRAAVLWLVPLSLFGQQVTRDYEMKTVDENRASAIRQIVVDLMGGKIMIDRFPPLHTLVLHGTAQEVDAAVALLSKYDVPPRQVEFRAYVVRAIKNKNSDLYLKGIVGRGAGAPAEPTPLPVALAPALDEMKQTLGYQAFELLDTAVNRASAFASSESSLGIGTADYQIKYGGVAISNDGKTVTVPNFSFTIYLKPRGITVAGRGQIESRPQAESSIENEVVIHGDERVVLGKLSAPNGAGDIFVILTAKPL